MTTEIFVYDHTEGKSVVREMTADELAAWKIDEEARLAEIAEKKAAQEALIANKKAAYKKLGLTDEEVEALMPTDKPLIIPSA